MYDYSKNQILSESSLPIMDDASTKLQSISSNNPLISHDIVTLTFTVSCKCDCRCGCGHGFRWGHGQGRVHCHHGQNTNNPS